MNTKSIRKCTFKLRLLVLSVLLFLSGLAIVKPPKVFVANPFDVKRVAILDRVLEMQSRYKYLLNVTTDDGGLYNATRGQKTTVAKDAGTEISVTTNRRTRAPRGVATSPFNNSKIQGNVGVIQDQSEMVGSKWKAKITVTKKDGKTVPVRKILPKAQVNVASMRDAPVKRAVSPTSGEPWPKPKHIDRLQTVLGVNPNSFKFTMSQEVRANCDILVAAVERYRSEVEKFWDYSQMLHAQDAKPFSKDESGFKTSPLYKVHISLEKGHCNGVYPPILMNESYSLSIDGETGHLSANEIWGILRGLETFFQLLYVPLKPDETVHIQGVHIEDKPAYPHRGLLLDTSRHFLSKSIILQNIDAMRQNKLNVLHWHIVDDQSFPFKSRKFPDLWKKGAYAPHLVYSFDDIREIIDYARLHGIRIMPEFDTPGHTRGWLGQPGLLAECGKNMEKDTGVFDITKESTFTFLKAFFTEVRGLFKDNMTHIGGDEVSVKCWYLNRDILTHLADYTHHELLNQYFSRFHKELQSIDSNWVTMVWEDVLRSFDVQLNPKQTWVEVWLDSKWVALAMNKGLNTIYSGCWYLDSVKGITPDWYRFYDCNIERFKPSSHNPSHGRLMGGEVCMWGEWVDDSNVIQHVWPRAIAPAERLWSNLATTSRTISVQARFQEQACRMWRRGIKVSPHNGAGHCSAKMPFDPDQTSSHGQWPETW